MAHAETGKESDREVVVLIARRGRYEITEHMSADSARKLGVQLLAAAGRVERSDARPDWP
jgi:hypothetical protein